MTWTVFVSLMTAAWALDVEKKPQGATITGITISCQGNGRIWGTDAFAQELDVLTQLGANGVSTHPYARIRADGRVTWRWHENTFPGYVTRPVREAKTRGMVMMMKPHLAYWGSPFSWRGAIAFDRPEDRERFFKSYKAWIVAIAKQTSDADIFVVGTELKGLIEYEDAWREVIAAVRQVTRAKLTYAANWDTYTKVPFWDALDMIGIQAYFPLSEAANPDEATLRQSWRQIMAGLEQFSQKHQRQILFTELGYNRSTQAAKAPWDYQQESSSEAAAIQNRCLKVALEVAAESPDLLAGVFLWKWFVGAAPYENFYLNEPSVTQTITETWRP